MPSFGKDEREAMRQRVIEEGFVEERWARVWPEHLGEAIELALETAENDMREESRRLRSANNQLNASLRNVDLIEKRIRDLISYRSRKTKGPSK